MLIMCEVVSNECGTLPPPPSPFLSPKEKKQKGWGTALAIQSKGRAFQKVQTVRRHGISWLFCLKHQLTFQTKSKGPKITWETLFWVVFFFFFPFSQSWRLDSGHSKRLFRKIGFAWLPVWVDDRVFIRMNHVRFSSVAFLRNGILLRRLQTPHWRLSKNGLTPPLSSLSPGCSTDVIIRVPVSDKSSCSACHLPFSRHESSPAMNPLLSGWARGPPHHAEEGMWTS